MGYISQAGIAAAYLTGESSVEDRNSARQRLTSRSINFLFVVDLYNEGVDIPEIDTVLFLRPTESLTVFLQQFGRGLRICEGKDCLTVLDFVGQANPRFDWQARFRALLDRTLGNRSLADQIRSGFPSAPSGCSIQLERKAQEYVIENIQRSIDSSRRSLVAYISTFEQDTGRKLTLPDFLDYHEITAAQLYKGKTSWNRLCERARVPYSDVGSPDPDSDVFGNGLRRIAHISGPRQIEDLLEILHRLRSEGASARLNTRHETLLATLFVSLFNRDTVSGIGDGLRLMIRNPNHLQELRDLLTWRFSKIAEVAPALQVSFDCILELHADYTRDEILIALGRGNLSNRPSVREGVVHLAEIKTDIFFVTLNKTDDSYSPSTMYEDYAISESLFHWQSQSTASVQSPTGQRYIHSIGRTSTALLFVRQDKADVSGYTCPYTFLGPLDYVRHTGSRPISIEWRLQEPIPARLLPVAMRLANT